MPADFNSPVLGYAAFTAIKLVGYSVFAGLHIQPVFGRTRGGPIAAGALRTGIGMAVGLAYGLASAGLVVLTQGIAVLLFLPGLIPMRLGEWWLLLRVLYGRAGPGAPPRLRTLIQGTVFSFLLDVPAILGLIKLGKLWIC